MLAAIVLLTGCGGATSQADRAQQSEELSLDAAKAKAEAEKAKAEAVKAEAEAEAETAKAEADTAKAEAEKAQAAAAPPIVRETPAKQQHLRLLSLLRDRWPSPMSSD